MDDRRFDALTRTLAGGEPDTRRTLLRLLAGGALGAVARFGLAEAIEAKPGGNHRRRGSLRTESRGKGKGKDKGRDKGKGPKGQRCSPRCADRGGRCCPDGSCAAQGSCCPGEKRCGGGCINQKSCCPSTEKECPGHRCVAKELCCPGERKCDDGECVSGCCLFEKTCRDGSCAGENECCPGQKWCQKNRRCIPEDGCCPGEKRCGNVCILLDLCCEEDPAPVCNPWCAEVICAHGQWACRPTERPACPPQKMFDCSTGECICPMGNFDCGDGNCCPANGTHTCIGGRCCQVHSGGGHTCLEPPPNG
jgi:hypothetical protein